MALSQTLVIARSACLKGLYSCILFHFRLYFGEILTRHILPQAVSLPADPLYRAKELMSPYITCWQMEQRWHRAAFLSSLHILQNDQCSGYSVRTCLGLSWGTSQLLLSQKWAPCIVESLVQYCTSLLHLDFRKTAPSTLQLHLKSQVNK